MADQSRQGSNTAKTSQSPPPASAGREKSFQPNKYNVENLFYPIGLFSSNGSTREKGTGGQFFNQEYLNYVVFYINVSDQSRVFTEAKAEIVGDIDITEQNRVTGKQASIGEATTAAATGTAIVGGVTGAAEGASKFAGNVGNTGGTVQFLKGTLGTAGARALQGAGAAAVSLGGAAVALQTVSDIKPTGKTKRLRTAIALNVPNEVNVGYKATYGEEELGAIFGAAAEAATNNQLGPGAAGVQGAAAKAIELSPARAALSSLYRAAANPRKEQLFKSMEFRRFSFNYQFAPRSPEEAANVKRIINTFKFYMHPEFQNNINKMLYLFPSEFDIVYYFGDKEHPHLNRISTCVLTDMNVNYSPNGQFSTFKDGFPTQINVQMQFLELETLTKERFLGQGPDGKVQFSNQDYADPSKPSF